jgi:oligopeptidase B
MNRRALLTGAAAFVAAPVARAFAGAPAPVVPVRPVHIEQLGRTRIDPYSWLKPANWKDVWRDPSVLDPEIRAWLATENTYAKQVLQPTAAIAERLFQQMKARTTRDAEAPATISGGFAYTTRFEAAAQYRRHLRTAVAGGPETLLLDEQGRAQGHSFLRVVGAGPSPDHRLFAWAEDLTGAEKYTIFLKVVATGEVIEGPRDAFGSFVVTRDSRWLFWTWRDGSSRPARIYRRLVTGGPDILVYEEPDPAFLLTITASNSQDYLFIRSWNDVTSEVRLVDVRNPDVVSPPVAHRQSGHLYSLEHWGDDFVVLTNSGGAVDFKLMRTPTADPAQTAWRDWIPTQPGRTIVTVRAFAGALVRLVRVEGNNSVVVRTAGGVERTIAFDEPAYVAALEACDYATPTARLTYESPRTPKTWFDIDLATGGRTKVAAQAVPGYDPAAYEVRRLHASAADGQLVPITLLSKRGRPGPRPLMLTGYGSYGADYETGFSIPNLALVDAGFTWAVAHVRGGSEKGRDWFEQSRKLHKRISFTDFIACTEHLIAARYARKGRVALHGYSAGGLLVGAALNMRPDLFGACIGQAPFVDMLNTMSDATHPLVPLTRPVWGDPLADPKAYDYIASYSPYENVRPQRYPPVLATTAVGDDRVGFWEPAKWIAALRAQSTSSAPMLLKTDMNGSHGGAGGRFDALRQMAGMYAFAIWALKA